MTRLNSVNTTDIADAIGLGCQTMCSVFNSDDDQPVPFFGSQVRPEAALSFSWAHSEAHVPGRHLNALLNAEDAVGVHLFEDCVEQHSRAAFFSYSGPVALPLNRHRIGGPLEHLLPHNIREGFHALYALARFRHSTRALKIAEASIRAIWELWSPKEGWNHDHVASELGLKLTESTFIAGLARSIGPLVKLYQATSCAPALDLAFELADKAMLECFPSDGAYDRERSGTHTHSTTCVMSSLAQLADLTRDARLMGRVRAFYDNGLNEIRDNLGWVIENSGDGSDPDRGEVNNTGDILETALILARWGHTEYYQDAERILRGHLLPSQLRDISFIPNLPNPTGMDSRRDVAQRHIGAFGFPAPYGHEPLGATKISFNLDIVGGAVGSLCEAYREVVRSDRAGHRVNLLFDHDADALTVRSPYTHDCLQVRAKRPGPLFVRIPVWVQRDRLTVLGTSETPRYTNGYLFLAQPPLNRWVSIDFPLPEQEVVLEHRTRTIRTRLRGDAVIAMENHGTDLTFFEPLDAPASPLR